MKNLFLKIRANNIVVLTAGCVLVLAGSLTALIFNNTAWWNYLLIGLGLAVGDAVGDPVGSGAPARMLFICLISICSIAGAAVSK